MKVFHLSSVHARYDNRILNKQCVSLVNYYETTLIVADGLGEEIYMGVKILDVGKPANRFSRMLFKTYSVFSLARKSKADVYQIHDPELLPLGFFFSLLGKRVIYDVHEDYVTSIALKLYIPWMFRKPLSVFFGLFERILSFKMHRLIAEKYYSRRFPSALPILNYPQREAVANVNGFSADSNCLIYTGNVTIDRGAQVLSELAKALPDYKIKLVGKCSQDTFEKLDAEDKLNLEIVGLERYVPFKEIIGYYNQGVLAGLALFPNNQHYAEKELTKFFEYMAVGLPIVASDFPVWKRLIESSRVGVCVNVEQPEEVIQAIEWLRNNPAQAREMGERGRELINTKLNWETEFDKLLKLYRSLEN